MKHVGKFYGNSVYFTAIFYIQWPFGIFYFHFVQFVAIGYILWSFWCIFSRFGMLYQEKSGNPAHFLRSTVMTSVEKVL
jgi:hypothetical protein